MPSANSLPIIDIAPLCVEPGRTNGDAIGSVAQAMRAACQEYGFFYIQGDGIDAGLRQRLAQVSQAFFDQDVSTKMQIRMELGGRAWRGFFPLGDELTSGRPDLKEGIYFGKELPPDDQRVMARAPLHGPNLFPQIDGFRETVLAYIEAMTQLGHQLLTGLSLSLGLHGSDLFDRFTYDPTILFRIFHYPAVSQNPLQQNVWGVGEHTDYGLLTILLQDDTGGLQVKTGEQWIDAPPIRDTFICNLGDMLDRLTDGLYRSTPHRVQPQTGQGRLAFPFFFDPSFDAKIEPIVSDHAACETARQAERWDGRNLRKLEGTYGEYLLQKVGKVFPELSRDQLP